MILNHNQKNPQICDRKNKYNEGKSVRERDKTSHHLIMLFFETLFHPSVSDTGSSIWGGR
jgi:hypothetical protein